MPNPMAAALLALGMAVAIPALDVSTLLTPSPVPSLSPIPVQSCCKVCRKGKACGDTCISPDKTCHVGPGCACDG
jgi:hypothetical protein